MVVAVQHAVEAFEVFFTVDEPRTSGASCAVSRADCPEWAVRRVLAA